MDVQYDVAVIGAGPAGLTAAIYGARAGLKMLVLERALPGGYVATTDLVENYPGFGEGIAGVELAEKMKQHALRFDTKIVSAEVSAITKSDKTLIVKAGQTEYTARAVIIATGTTPKKLNIPGEDELRGRGVSYCATCDGPLFRGRRITVIGGGNSAIQEGLFLLKYVEHITFVEFMPQLTADKILQDEIKKEKRAAFFLHHVPVRIGGTERVESITIRNRETKEEETIETGGVFIYVGLSPFSQFVRGTVKLDEFGFVVTNEKLETSVPGIYAAGDIRSDAVRQVVTACGDGAAALIHAHHYIERIRGQA
jgi:thioredoxin reductase (NADPH)